MFSIFFEKKMRSQLKIAFKQVSYIKNPYKNLKLKKYIIKSIYGKFNFIFIFFLNRKKLSIEL